MLNEFYTHYPWFGTLEENHFPVGNVDQISLFNELIGIWLCGLVHGTAEKDKSTEDII